MFLPLCVESKTVLTTDIRAAEKSPFLFSPGDDVTGNMGAAGRYGVRAGRVKFSSCARLSVSLPLCERIKYMYGYNILVKVIDPYSMGQ